MRKTALLLVLTSLFISCSNEDNNNSSANSPLENTIKKITETTYIGGSVDHYSADFNYENGVLKTITDATHKIELFYNGSKISSSIIYTNNVVTNTNTFSYNGNLLETILNTTNNSERTLYSYNNGVLLSEKNQGLVNSYWQTVYTYNYIFTNGNVTEQNQFYQNDTPYKNTYEYDTKLNPMHYMNPYVRVLITLESSDFKNYNNEIKAFSFLNPTTPILAFTSQITYNSQNLPINIKKYTAGNNLVSEATFEYN